MKMRKRLFGLSPEQGAQTLLYLAQSGEVSNQSGGYYVQSRVQVPSIHVRNDSDALQLWMISAQITGVDFPLL
ncbi:MAG: hypothetical protein ABUL58_07990 [Steroidobacter sp.]